MKNKYIKRSHISEVKFRATLKFFCNDFTAQVTAKQSKISRPTINKIYLKIRKRISELSSPSEKLSGEVELDESYFGARRVRGKRGRGASGKTPVFGLLKRNGQVYVEIVKDCSKASLLPIIQGKILEETKVYTDGWKSYDGLIVHGYKHYRIYHSKDEFARGKNHINGIESFWSYAKRRLAKFNGLHKEHFYLHLKETEYRFNHRNKSMYNRLLKAFRDSPL